MLPHIIDGIVTAIQIAGLGLLTWGALLVCGTGSSDDDELAWHPESATEARDPEVRPHWMHRTT